MSTQATTSTHHAAKAQPAAGSERRTALRRQPTLGTMLRLDASSKGGPRLGLVWNISSTGISFLAHEALEPGTTVSGKLATVDEKNALPVTVQVAHSRKLSTGDYVLGASFDRSLSAEEVRPFLAREA